MCIMKIYIKKKKNENLDFVLVSYLKRNFYDFLVILEHRSRQILNFLTIKAGFIAVPNQQISKQKKKPTLSETWNQKADLFLFQKVSAFKKNVQVSYNSSTDNVLV